MNEIKFECRGIFSKKDPAIYISHLDLVRTMTRAMKRTKLPVWFTKGFNQRLYLNFPLALSLGVESEYEVMDFELTEDISPEILLEKVNEVCPTGIEFRMFCKPVAKNKDVAFAEYFVKLTPTNNIIIVYDKLAEFLSQEKIIVMKRSKAKGFVEMDIKPYINVLSYNNNETSVDVILRLPAGNSLNINVGLFYEAFSSFCGENNCEFYAKRLKILQSDGSDFV